MKKIFLVALLLLPYVTSVMIGKELFLGMFLSIFMTCCFYLYERRVEKKYLFLFEYSFILSFIIINFFILNYLF